MAWTDPMTAVAGNPFTAAQFNTHVRDNLNAIRRQDARKTANEGVASSTALQDDNHLVLPVVSGEVWAFEFELFYQGNGGALKVAIAVPAGSGVWGGHGADVLATNNAGAKVIDGFDAFGDANTLAFGDFRSTTNIVMASLHGSYAPSSTGNIQLRWAQSSSVATATTLVTGSYALAYRIA